MRVGDILYGDEPAKALLVTSLSPVKVVDVVGYDEEVVPDHFCLQRGRCFADLKSEREHRGVEIIKGKVRPEVMRELLRELSDG